VLPSSQVRLSQNGAYIPPPPKGQPPRIVSVDISAANSRVLLAGRRSNSAGPTPTAGPSMPKNTRTLSNGSVQRPQDWEVGMPLPGPPPLPPPPSQRSRSASAHGDGTAQPAGTRPRPPRLYIREHGAAKIE